MIELVDPKIENYCISKSTLPSKHCRTILEYTKAHVPMSQMLIGELEASFLGFLIRSIRAKRVLEIGCFTGYSALAMAERLPKDGELITLDVDPANAKLAQSFWDKSPDGSKIKLMVGPAIESLKKLKGKFDFVFIDADKVNYIHYLKETTRLLSAKGLVAADNCLWGGEVLNQKSTDEGTQAIQAFNAYVQSRKNFESMLVPIRDGIFLIGKRAG